MTKTSEKIGLLFAALLVASVSISAAVAPALSGPGLIA